MSNDACTGPTVLSVGTPVPGDTTQAKTDFSIDPNSTTCVSQLTNDLTYSFTASAAGRYNFVVTPSAATDGGPGNLDAVLEVVPTCSIGALSVCEGASDFGLQGKREGVGIAMAAGSTVTAIVGAYDCTSNGPFTLSVNPAPPGGVCATAVAMATQDGGSFTASGDTSTSVNSTTDANCGAVSFGPELFYAFTVSALSDATVTVTPTGATAIPDGGGYQPVVYLRDGCANSDGGAASELTCGLNESGGSAIASAKRLQPGSYIAVVDGYGTTQGTFDLSVALTPPPPAPTNDNCTAPAPLALGASVSGDTTTALDDFSASASCFGVATGSASPDVVYAITPSASGSYAFTLVPDANFDAAFYIIGSSCTAGVANSCAGGADAFGPGGTERFIANLTAGTTYYLVVDGYSGASGTFTLSSAPAPAAPANDTCAAPAEIAIAPFGDGGVGGSATFDTFGANDDYQPVDGGRCAPVGPGGVTQGYASGPDVVFHATLPSSTMPYSVSYLDPDGGLDQGSAEIIVRSTPCATGAELTCGGGSVGPALPDGGQASEIYIIVDDVLGGPYAAGTIQVSSP